MHDDKEKKPNNQEQGVDLSRIRRVEASSGEPKEKEDVKPEKEPESKEEKKPEGSAAPKKGKPEHEKKTDAPQIKRVVPEASQEEELPSLLAFFKGISVKMWIWFAFLVTLLAATLFFVAFPAFRVQSITISGNKHVSQEMILEQTKISEGDHLLSHIGGGAKDVAHLHYGALEKKLMNSDPYISKAEIYPKYPGQVYIKITERKKVAYVAIPDGYAIIAEDGVVLSLEQGDVPQGIPEIRGLPIRSAKVGKPLDLTSEEGYDICITILGAILGADATQQEEGEDFDFLAHVVSVRYCDNMTTFIDLDVPGSVTNISVKIGSMSTISDDMNWLRYAVTSGYFADKSGTVLDMTGKQYILR